MRVSRAVIGLSIAVASAAGAQLPAVRQLGPAIATTTESFGSVPSVRALSDGRVLVSDMARRRLVMFDSSLARSQPVLSPTGAAALTYPVRGGLLIPLPADTTLVVDAAGYSFVVIDGAGKVARAMSVPRASDVFYFSSDANGVPRVDPQMRLIYRSRMPPKGFSMATGNAIFPDSSPIVAVPFETRRADTLGWTRVPAFPPTVSALEPGGRRRFTTVAAPFELTDEWAALPNGSVAIIRWRDYHVDWVEADGRRESSPKTAWNWVRMSDDDKARFVDSLRVIYRKNDSLQSGMMMSMGGNPAMAPIWETLAVSPSEVPDYPPPFVPRATRVDLDGRIWVLERAVIGGPPAGLIYDIIDRSGQIIDRVQLPLNAAVIGFGPGGSVFLSITPSNMALAASVPAVNQPIMGMGGGGPPMSVKVGRAVLPPRQ